MQLQLGSLRKKCIHSFNNQRTALRMEKMHNIGQIGNFRDHLTKEEELGEEAVQEEVVREADLVRTVTFKGNASSASN